MPPRCAVILPHGRIAGILGLNPLTHIIPAARPSRVPKRVAIGFAIWTLVFVTKKSAFNWTNKSVKLLAGDGDPIDVILSKARNMALRAREQGWSGPPFNPFELADKLRLEISPNENIREARTLPVSGGKIRIEFNPTRSRARVNYSVAHEIAHTLFPDCTERIRNRAAKNEMLSDEWQLEMLCNLAAAELLMPIGSFKELANRAISILDVVELRSQFATSSESLMLRWVHLTNEPAFIFSASTEDDDAKSSRYRIDYIRGNLQDAQKRLTGHQIPDFSVVRNCTAIGFTDAAIEQWSPKVGKMRVECVGLPSYAGHVLPRVVGICRPTSQEELMPNPLVVKGNATEPSGPGVKIVAHVVNDKALTWGAGFGAAVAAKYPAAKDNFKAAIMNRTLKLSLGSTFVTTVSRDLHVFQMIAQKGYGEQGVARLSYVALRKCLEDLARWAENHSASVHLPKIGTGYGGGEWTMISELIRGELCERGIQVRIYELPNTRESRKNESGQQTLL